MDDDDIKLIRIALFEISKENDQEAVADLMGKKVVNLENPKSEHLQLISVLRMNIKKKIISLESKDLSKRITRTPVIDNFDGLEGRGAPAKSLVLPINDLGKKAQLQQILKSNDDTEFRKLCAEIANNFAKLTSSPKGVVGFVQFNLQLHKNTIKRFIVILITDFSTETITTDDVKVLTYLDKAFKHNFKTTTIYPHIISVKITSRKQEITPMYIKDTDHDKVKIHIRTKDSAIYKTVGAQQPKDPQKEIEKAYKDKSSEFKNLEQFCKQFSTSDLKSTSLDIRVGEDKIKINVDLNTFINECELFISPKGQGILFKNMDISVFLGDKNLLSEQKINFKNSKELG